MSIEHLSEQEKIRRQKLANIQSAGIDPYPAPSFPVTHYSADIKSEFF